MVADHLHNAATKVNEVTVRPMINSNTSALSLAENDSKVSRVVLLDFNSLVLRLAVNGKQYKSSYFRKQFFIQGNVYDSD